MRIGQNSILAFLSQSLTSIAGFAATLYIARELGESTLGAYALVIAVVVWMKTIGGMGLRTALKKRLSEPGEDGSYLAAAVLLQMVLFVLLVGFLLGLGDRLEAYLRGTSPTTVVLLVGVALSFAFVTAALDGQNRIHLTSILYPTDRFLRSVVQIVLIVMGFGLTGLFLGYGIGAFVGTVLGVYLLSGSVSLPSREHFSSLTRYARYSWLNNLSSRSFASMDTLVLGLFVAQGLIGVYEVAWNLASILAMFSLSVGTAMFPAMSELSSKGDLEKVRFLFTDSIIFAGLLLIPGAIGALVVGDLVLLIYGESFTEGYIVLIVLTLARAFHAYEIQVVNTLNALDKPSRAFRIDGLFVVANVGLNFLLVWEYGWVGAAVATLTSALVALAYGYRSIQAVIDTRIPLEELSKQVLAAGVMGFVVWMGRLSLPPTIVTGVVLVVAGGAIYFVSLAFLSVRFREVVVDNVPELFE